MKYINTNRLANGQYEDLSNIVDAIQIIDHNVIGEPNFTWREFTVEELKEDNYQVIYAPTKLVHSQWSHEVELSGYQPLFTILKELCQ